MFKQSSLPKFLEATRKWSYGEVGQINPLRWQIFYYDKENHTLEPQSSLIRCKDFFNDVVSAYNGKPFSIYGFSTEGMKLNDEGMYFLLHHVESSLVENLNKWLIPLVKEQLDCEVVYNQVEKDKVLLFIPRKIFEKTYYISLFSLLVRASNYGQVFENFDHVWKPSQSKWATEQGQWLNNNKAIKWQFNLPPIAKDYWMYAGEACNSKTMKELHTHVIHNNGILNWSHYLPETV